MDSEYKSSVRFYQQRIAQMQQNIKSCNADIEKLEQERLRSKSELKRYTKLFDDFSNGEMEGVKILTICTQCGNPTKHHWTNGGTGKVCYSCARQPAQITDDMKEDDNKYIWVMPFQKIKKLQQTD